MPDQLHLRQRPQTARTSSLRRGDPVFPVGGVDFRTGEPVHHPKESQRKKLSLAGSLSARMRPVGYSANRINVGGNTNFSRPSLPPCPPIPVDAASRESHFSRSLLPTRSSVRVNRARRDAQFIGSAMQMVVLNSLTRVILFVTKLFAGALEAQT